MLNVTLPDGSKKEIAENKSFFDLANDISPHLAKAALAVKVDGQILDITTTIQNDCSPQIITARDPQGLEIMRHSCAHVMAEAILTIWPKAKLVYGPAIEDGFYYDIDLEETIRPTDFEKIEAAMKDIAKADKPFIRTEMSKTQALEKMALDKYKTDNINRADGDIISFYSQGDGFEDLCKGPHIPSTSKIGKFKIMSVAGAYWHGDSTQTMLQRVYGTTFPDKKQLKTHLHNLEEAKKRDHRIIGKKMELFSFSDMGPGFAFMHPKGMVLWNAIVDFWRSVHFKYDYKEIKTPIILNEELWHKSGHWQNYKENMYFTTVDDTTYAIKPMNCPGGCLLYNNSQHSYKQFPLRVAELGLVHRHEASGVMHGLFRVRQFTQDDAHIFCTPEQIEQEIIGVIDLTFELYKAFGFDDIQIELSTKPDKHIGSDEIWDKATNALENAMKHRDIDYKINPGDGAFYGPKIDFHIKDCLKRSWQLGTIQLDFSMPERFELTYTDKDNTEKTPVMIHRAVLGSFERFIGILIEHYAGDFPLWLSPIHAVILPISEKTNDYANNIAQKLKNENILADIDLSDEKIGAKIARAHQNRTPYMLVVGPAEADQNAVNLRIRGSKENKTITLDEFVAITKNKILNKDADLAI
jgi:threonyl-tRNA synthetase